MKEIYLDVRGLEHPFPLEQAVECLKNLADGEVLVMTHHREPFPLYEIATSFGFLHTTIHENSDVVIRFYR